MVSLGSQLSIIPLWGIITDDKQLISGLKTEG